MFIFAKKNWSRILHALWLMDKIITCFVVLWLVETFSLWNMVLQGDSASSILQHMLQQEEEFAVIHGSTYKDDKNEEYCYLMLSDIILHMEMGRYACYLLTLSVETPC